MKYNEMNDQQKIAHLENLVTLALPYVEEALESDAYSKEGKKQIRKLIKDIRTVAQFG